MTLTMTPSSSAANTKGEGAALEIARPLQDLKNASTVTMSTGMSSI